MSAAELKNIDLFAQLMDRMEQSQDAAMRHQRAQDPVMRTLYDSMVGMHPRIVKGIEECVERHKQLMQQHEKIAQGVAAFDRVVAER